MEAQQINYPVYEQKTSSFRNKGTPFKKAFSFWPWIGGIMFTMVIALAGYGLSHLPGPDHVGPLALSILIAVLYRQLFGYPETLRTGIQFSSKRLLRFAIILYGLKLNIDVIFEQGLGLMILDMGAIIFSIGCTLLLAKWLKAEFSLSLLLGIGTGVCGAAAIAAVSPIIKANDEDTAVGVGMIALIGTIFSLGYTLAMPFLPFTAEEYGIWTGASLHEIAHVALAASPAGQDGLAIALLAKLGRVFLLIPLCFILMYWVKRKGKNQTDTKIEFPWFLLGFIMLSFFGSYVLGKHIHVSSNVLNDVSRLTTFILSMAMVGLGLNVNIQAFRSKALRPLIAMTITSILLSILIFVLVLMQ